MEGYMTEEKRVRAFDLEVINKPVKTIELTEAQDKIVRALKQAREEQATTTHYLLLRTKLEYPLLMRSIDGLLKHRVVIRNGSEYYLAAFPKGVIIYPTY